MQIKSAVFHMSARDIQAAPEWDRPEFAFIGRSNVGKSSMINMLSNKDALAKVSATPGKTQLLNFFIMNEAWSLVDLPGYGYAKVAKSEKINFNESVGDYLEQRDNLRIVFVLIDSRLAPQPIDVSFVSWLSGCQVPFALVFTKADKQSPGKTKATIAEFLAAIGGDVAVNPPVIISSSKNRTGRVEILKLIEAALKV
ncbi:YihA family ribosome biogenesis GTP-binding protein [Luteolibacter yonseiensis]|uniref:Probable GTP-binding protein EngB n=1 Tax=Luteolibacter yonseiensis TaxID=1144680 RepID=A0A934QYC1_9BACT|nr:ribosome biogenesis GTP-binding protein YihA/YsxC [Luteolibacter yonseiensis]MBK1814938.1 YihA family ribosome biogenesis GTP-binding protein [Luteolibacter yonseiensis]